MKSHVLTYLLVVQALSHQFAPMCLFFRCNLEDGSSKINIYLYTQTVSVHTCVLKSPRGVVVVQYLEYISETRVKSGRAASTHFWKRVRKGYKRGDYYGNDSIVGSKYCSRFSQ